METEKQGSIFDKFTNQYQLSKTLRFELIPTEKTKEWLKKNQILEKDAVIDNSYNQAKPYFDVLHREFIEEALAPEKGNKLSFYDIEKAWKEFQENKREKKKEFEDVRKIFYKKIASLLDDHANNWKQRYAPDAKKSGTSLIYSAEILPILKKRFPRNGSDEALFTRDENGNERYIFDSFNGFTTYLGKFQETRANLYKNDGTATAVATRVVENLLFFLENKKKFEKYLEHAENLKLSETEKRTAETEYYSQCMTQRGIEAYNSIIAKLNERMKKLRDAAEKGASKYEYPLLKKLYNQVLAEKKVEVEEIAITKNEDILPKLKEFDTEVRRAMRVAKELGGNLAKGTYSNDYDGLYLHNGAINTIARRWFVSASDFESTLPQKGKSKEGTIKVAAFVSFTNIQKALEGQMAEEVFKERLFNEFKLVKGASAFSQFVSLFFKELLVLEKEYLDKHGRFTALKLEVFERGKKDINVDAFKEALDGGLRILQLMKYFVLSAKKSEDKPSQINNEFYNLYDEFYGDPDKKHPIVRYYDAFRNFLTKKPSDQDKIKLNFENGSLLTGFDKNKEPEKLGIILRKNNTYFLGIINNDRSDILDEKKHKSIFDNASWDAYEKMEYKLLPDPKRMVPKIAFAKKNLELFGCTEEIRNIKAEFAQFQADKQQNKEKWDVRFDRIKLGKLIEYYQRALVLGGYKKTYEFEWKKPSQYISMGDFNDDISKRNYRIAFRTVAKEYVDQCVERGDLYLFKIHSKDFSSGTNGRKNIHTLYFLSLFSAENLKGLSLRLAGNAEIFCREPAVKKHEVKRKFPRLIVEYKRFTERKYFFHIPIVLNAKAALVSERKFNLKLNQNLTAKNDVRIIGIDRGEKHLVYYSVIDQKGTIVDDDSLNEIDGVNYFEKLRGREKERLEQRRSWKTITQIKDLKRGYISQVVHKLSELVVKHNAIIVFEDLNMHFKQKRGGIERSVYQQLEKALIDKFGYIVLKSRASLEVGGVLNGYQLAAPFESFEKMGKQNGVIFYTNPEYTSITDPITGWRPHIYIKSGVSNEEALNIFTQKAEVQWDDDRKSYVIRYDQKDFAKDLPSRQWALYADAPRLERYRNQDGYWEARKIDPNKLLSELFSVWNFNQLEGEMSEQIAIMYQNGDLKGERVVNGKNQGFFKALRYILNLIQQIRNSDSIRFIEERDKQGNIKENSSGNRGIRQVGSDIDFIASPVKPFFTTPNPFQKENLCNLSIENGDANGAYNIARKGIITLERIAQHPEKPDLYISRCEWDKFAQSQHK